MHVVAFNHLAILAQTSSKCSCKKYVNNEAMALNIHIDNRDSIWTTICDSNL